MDEKDLSRKEEMRIFRSRRAREQQAYHYQQVKEVMASYYKRLNAERPFWREEDAAKHRFKGRGIDDRTIDALVSAGIWSSETLRVMNDSDVKKLKGIGAASLKSIQEYKRIFNQPIRPAAENLGSAAQSRN